MLMCRDAAPGFSPLNVILSFARRRTSEDNGVIIVRGSASESASPGGALGSRHYVRAELMTGPLEVGLTVRYGPAARERAWFPGDLLAVQYAEELRQETLRSGLLRYT
jgi:hypothetical protein